MVAVYTSVAKHHGHPTPGRNERRFNLISYTVWNKKKNRVILRFLTGYNEKNCTAHVNFYLFFVANVSYNWTVSVLTIRTWWSIVQFTRMSIGFPYGKISLSNTYR